MFELIRADLHRKRQSYGVRPEDKTFFRQWITPFLEFGTIAVIVYRFGRWAYGIRIPVIRQILIAIYLFVDVFCVAVTGIKIHPESEIGPGLVIHTFSCIHVLVKAHGSQLHHQSRRRIVLISGDRVVRRLETIATSERVVKSWEELPSATTSLSRQTPLSLVMCQADAPSWVFRRALSRARFQALTLRLPWLP